MWGPEEEGSVSDQGRCYGRGRVSENEQGPLGHKAGWSFWQVQRHERSMEVE